MTKERYCSFEVSKLLQEKGFDGPCRSYFINDLGDYRRCTVEITNRDCSSKQILRSTHQMAMDWLREIHKLHIGIVRGPNGYHITIETIPLGVVKYVTREIVGTNYVESFRDAVEASLKYCLTELIK